MKSNRKSNPFLRSVTLGFTAAVVMVFSSQFASAASQTWANSGTDFNTLANWNAGVGPVPGAADNATFTGARVANPNLSASATVQGLTFSTSASSGYTLSATAGQALTLTSVGNSTTVGNAAAAAILSTNTTGTNTISTPIILGGAAGTSATFAQILGGSLVVSGDISSTNAITGLVFPQYSNNSASSYTLSGNNTYAGTTSISFLTLNINSDTALSSGNLISTNSAHFNNTSGSARTLANGLTLTSAISYDGAGAAQAMTFGGAVALNSNLTVTNAGTLTLNGTVTPNADGRVLSVNNAAGTLTLGGVVSWGAFQSQKSSAGTLVLSSANTGAGLAKTIGTTSSYVSTLRINAGTVAVANVAAFGTGVVDIRGATLLATTDLSGVNKLTSTFVNATGSPTIGGTNNIELGGAYILNNGAGNQSLTINNTGTTKLSGTVSLTDLNADNQTLTVSVPTTAGASEISGVIQNTSVGTATGSFTKAGTGLLKLSATNTYTGATTITGGTLQLSGTGAINGSSGVTVNGSGAKFLQTSNVVSTPPVTLTLGTVDGFSAGAVTVASNFSNVITNGNGTASALTLDALTYNGSGTINFNLAGGATTAAPLVVTNALTTAGGAGSVSLNATALSPLVAGTTYNLISYGSYGEIDMAKFVKGSFAGLSARQVTFTNDTAAKVIKFSYGGAPDSVRWTGAGDNSWVAGLSNSNWTLVTGGTTTDFIPGDDVVFNDGPGVVTPAVSITDNVNPASTTFSNSILNYDLSSPGGFGITGTGTLAKNGSAALTINNANTYTGGTTLNNGTLNLDNTSAIGTGALTLTGGTLDNTLQVLDINLVLVPTPVTLTTNNLQNWNGDFAFGGTTALNMGTGAVNLGGNRTVTTNGSATLTVGGAIGGAFGLTKSGSGTLQLNGASAFTGNVVINNGTFIVGSGGTGNGNTSVLGVANTGKTVTINAGATVTGNSTNWFGNQNNLGTIPAFIVNGGTLNTNNYTTIGAITLNGGTMTDASTQTGANYQGFSLRGGSVTVIGSTPSTITAVSPTATTRGHHLSANTIFTVADVTGDSNVDLTVSAPLRNQDGDFGNAAGGLTKAGLGTMVLSASNTYTGVTTVNVGTLQLGDGVTDGSIAGTSIVANGTLAFNSVGNPTYAGVISGSGTVSKSGAGTTTLSGANTFTGATSVTGGTLALTGANTSTSISVNGSGAKLLSSVPLSAAVALTQGTFDGISTVSSVTVGAGTGGILANGNGGSATLTANTVTFSGAGGISLIPVGGASPTIAPLVVGTLNTTGTPGAITISANPVTPFQVGTTYNLIGFTSFSGSASEFVAGPGFSARLTPTFAKTSSFITLSVTGDNPVWTGVNSDVWTTAANGNNGGSPNWATKTAHTATNFWANDAVEFNDTYTLGASTLPVTQTTATIQGGVSPASTTFNNSAIDYTIASSDSTGIVSGSLTKNGTAKVTLTTLNTLAGPTTINGGTLQIGDGVTDASIAATASITNNGSLVYNLASLSQTYDKIISGTGSVTTTSASGSLGLTLSGVNTFSGGVNVDGGVLVATNASSLGATTNTLSFGAGGNGKLQLGGNSITLGGLNSDSTAIIENTVSGNPVLTINSASDSNYGGIIRNGTGTVLLTKTGASKLTLLGDNTYTGVTSVNDGTLQIGNGVSATGKLLGNAAVNVSGGTLSLQTAGAIIQNTITTSGTGTLVETVDNAIIGTTALTLGTSQTLSRPNSYTGDTTMNANNLTLTITNPSAAGTGRIHTSQGTANYAFHLDGGGDFELANSLRNFGGATINIDVNNNGDESEDGVVKLNGASQLGDSGTTTVNVTGGFNYSLYLASVSNSPFHGHTDLFNPTSASLKIGAFGSVNNGDHVATLNLGGTHTGNSIGNITETLPTPLTLIKSNASTWTFTGTNVYTGTTTISGGTLQIGDGGTTGTLSATSAVTDNATLAFNRSDALAVPNVIAGTGSVSKLGAGTTTLSGVNTYTGNTTVSAGTLEITNAYLANAADVSIAAAAKLKLTFVGTDTVRVLTIAGIDMAPGTYGASGSGAANIDNTHFAGTGTLTVTGASAYAAWATLKGLTGANNGATQDPDFDGIANELEFVLGGNPLASDTSILPVQTSDATDFIFTFNRADESEAEVSLNFQYGTTLTGWTPIAIGAVSNLPTVTVTENLLAPDTVVVRIPKGANTTLFGRLQASK